MTATYIKREDVVNLLSIKGLKKTGLYYYGRRSYNPRLGRWVNRDPIGENGGENLMGFVNNSPVDVWDILGRHSCEELEYALKKAEEGQEISMKCAKTGKTPREVGGKQYGNPIDGAPDPVSNEFEKDLRETGLALIAHIAAQTANLVDGALIKKPGNFYNYWGLVEVWRHQRLIDRIKKQIKEKECDKCKKNQ